MAAEATFLSTLPARGATVQPLCRDAPVRISIHAPREGSDTRKRAVIIGRANFYPRSPRGERLVQGRDVRKVPLISIHAPREGSDP